jgi:hypothetical protein
MLKRVLKQRANIQFLHPERIAGKQEVNPAVNEGQSRSLGFTRDDNPILIPDIRRAQPCRRQGRIE